MCALQLPPPVHGVTTINARIVASEALRDRFELDVVPLQFSDTVAELGAISLGKLVEAATVGVRIAAKLATRPDAFYITMAVQRPACFRDAGYLALAATLGVPRIVHLHARPERAVLPLLRQALRGATVILLSPALRDDLGDAVNDAQVRYVANGIPDPGEPSASGEARVPRVLFLSNLLIAKGPLALIDALAQVAARGVDFEATFAGAPSRELGEREIHTAIARAGLADRVRYVGAIETDEKDAVLRDHDVFVLPSAREGFPLVVLEAMATGLPVVATRVGAMADLVADGETGVLVEPRASGLREPLADAIERLLRDKELRTRMGRAGRARFVERFTAAQFERQLGDVLAEAAGDRAGDPGA